ncbi:hypothetical protein OVY01_11730 [Robbsia sp. Bb-Pol-6]|uniref:Outer membrane protein beta-barrel domain-containing protein n=1 Tax=Robbsia betulipollinis TaxID=2981849 RepID=A0ABT3ZMX3_9BURK|nr:hypothetical protein [Robbsia betulipollinis]MCY0387894.1 hypothetical protein [Robbsia betulipollinis]
MQRKGLLYRALKACIAIASLGLTLSVASPAAMANPLPFSWTGEHHFKLYEDVSVRSYHVDRAEKRENNFNEANYGGGLELTNETWGVMGGYYRNSIRRPSFYALVRFTPFHVHFSGKDELSIGGVAGGLSGYVKQFTATTSTSDWVAHTDSNGYPYLTRGVDTQTQWHTKGRGWMPGAGIMLSYEHGQAWGANVLVVPEVKSLGVAAFVGLQLRFHLFSIASL